MEKNELLDTEVVAQVSAQGSHGMKTAAVAGVSFVAGALLWNYVAKPLGRKIKHGIHEAHERRNQVKEQAAEGRKSK